MIQNFPGFDGKATGKSQVKCRRGQPRRQPPRQPPRRHRSSSSEAGANDSRHGARTHCFVPPTNGNRTPSPTQRAAPEKHRQQPATASFLHKKSKLERSNPQPPSISTVDPFPTMLSIAVSSSLRRAAIVPARHIASPERSLSMACANSVHKLNGILEEYREKK